MILIVLKFILLKKIMVVYNSEPIVADVMVAIEQQLSVPAETQRLMYKGQNLHQLPQSPLRNFGKYF